MARGRERGFLFRNIRFAFVFNHQYVITPFLIIQSRRHRRVFCCDLVPYDYDLVSQPAPVCLDNGFQ